MLGVKVFKHMAHRNSRLQEVLSLSVCKQFIFAHGSCTSEKMHSCKVPFIEKKVFNLHLQIRPRKTALENTSKATETGERVGKKEIPPTPLTLLVADERPV